HAETEQLLASISSILIGVDGKGLVTRWNAFAEQAFGIPAENVLGRPLAESGIRWLRADSVDRILRCQGTTQSTRLEELPFETAQGKYRFLGMSVNPVKADGHSQAGLLLLGSDTTERKTLEEQLRQAQKLEAIGQLAAGIAHE